jgi:hypothetical protein
MALRAISARFLLLAFASLGLCAAGAGATRPALAKEPSLEAGGYPVLGSAPNGLTLRFIDGARFGIGLVLRNRSGRQLTLIDAQIAETPNGLIHQLGTRIVPWNPPHCPRNAHCPAFVFLRSPFGSAKANPFALKPRASAGVQLNLQLGHCAAVPLASFEPLRFVDVAYRRNGQTVRRERLALGSATLMLRRPAASACDHRPHSQIAIDGPFADSSDGRFRASFSERRWGQFRAYGAWNCTVSR